MSRCQQDVRDEYKLEATAEHNKVKSNRTKTRLWENPRSFFNEADDSMSIMMRSKHFKVELPFVWMKQALDVFPNFITQLPKRSHCRDLNYLPTNYRSQVSQIPVRTTSLSVSRAQLKAESDVKQRELNLLQCIHRFLFFPSSVSRVHFCITSAGEATVDHAWKKSTRQLEGEMRLSGSGGPRQNEWHSLSMHIHYEVLGWEQQMNKNRDPTLCETYRCRTVKSHSLHAVLGFAFCCISDDRKQLRDAALSTHLSK